MSFEILISTMDQKNHDIINRMNLNSKAVIINQSTTTQTRLINTNGNKIVWIDDEEKGLSKSRNKAINNSEGKINLIADDDVVFRDNLEFVITEEFKKNKNADIIAFQVKRHGKIRKNYWENPKELNYISSMKVSSVEIAFRNEAVKGKIEFDERFGSGAKYKMGEENIFLYDCLKKGLRVFYVPTTIADLYDTRESSWFEGYNRRYFFCKGAMFARMSKFLSNFLIIQFVIRKKKLYKNKFSFFTVLTEMYKGKKDFLKKR